jgi:anti-sigma regulatory factor (Ser/Thr protein kinase)
MTSDKALEGYFMLKGGVFQDAGAVSKELKDALTTVGAPSHNIRRAAVAAFEAEMNVIIHAVAGSLGYVISEDEVKITVTDMGPGIPDIDLAMKEGYTTAPKWAKDMGWGGGLGLPNIKRNCDSLKIDTKVGEGTTLEIVVKLKDNEEASGGSDESR